MKRARHTLLVCTALGVIIAPASHAADITAERTALIYDLLDPLTKTEKPPAGADPEIFAKAVSVVKDESLAGQGGRPNFSETGTLDKYGKAMFLGSRAPEFAADIGHIRDLVASGNRPALEQALSDLWVKAGRAKPDVKALAPVIESLYGAKDAEPEETVRHIIDKPDHRIEIAHARAGGRMEVDVITKNPDGTDKDRTAFQGITETVPTANGELQRHIKLDKVCTNTPATDREALEKLTGEWKSVEQGRTWLVTNKGDRVTLGETRGDAPTITYEGTFRLGRVAATHTISAVTDMDDSLPMEVRQQIITKNIPFRVSLEFCSSRPGKMGGTWSSQHVTYNGMSLQISRIHDPYDLSLTLTHGGGAEKVAQGAAKDEMP